jgi:hypothetical protein
MKIEEFDTEFVAGKKTIAKKDRHKVFGLPGRG